MHVFLTGGSGYIGSAVLRRLVSDGHRVTALTRSEAAAAKVWELGAEPLHGDITDSAWLAGQLILAEGAIHTASPGDATSAAVDASVAEAAERAYTDTGKPFVHTGGIWAYGNGGSLTEESRPQAIALVAWRPAIERKVLVIAGARPVVVVPGVVYGHGGGVPTIVSRPPSSNADAFPLIGDGSQHWVTVHVDDLADLYVRALEKGRGGAYYIASNGDTPTVRELCLAAARAAGTDAVVPEHPDQTRSRLGELFAEALLLDQRATGEKARTQLGWESGQPSLVAELERGSYAPGAQNSAREH